MSLDLMFNSCSEIGVTNVWLPHQSQMISFVATWLLESTFTIQPDQNTYKYYQYQTKSRSQFILSTSNIQNFQTLIETRFEPDGTCVLEVKPSSRALYIKIEGSEECEQTKLEFQISKFTRLNEWETSVYATQPNELVQIVKPQDIVPDGCGLAHGIVSSENAQMVSVSTKFSGDHNYYYIQDAGQMLTRPGLQSPRALYNTAFLKGITGTPREATLEVLLGKQQEALWFDVYEIRGVQTQNLSACALAAKHSEQKMFSNYKSALEAPHFSMALGSEAASFYVVAKHSEAAAPGTVFYSKPITVSSAADEVPKFALVTPVAKNLSGLWAVFPGVMILLIGLSILFLFLRRKRVQQEELLVEKVKLYERNAAMADKNGPKKSAAGVQRKVKKLTVKKPTLKQSSVLPSQQNLE